MTKKRTQSAENEEAPRPVYGSVEQWVTQRFIPMYRRALGGECRWCAQWWRHAEAISRLTILWHTWERLRLEPLGMATWYAGHLDHHLPLLLSSRGPFFQCSEREHVEPRMHTTEPAPPGWWDVTTPIAGDDFTPSPADRDGTTDTGDGS